MNDWRILAMFAVAMAAAFIAGTFFPQSKSIRVVVSPPAAPRADPLKLLQLDQLCAQSAERYAKSHKLFSAGESSWEHGFNVRTGKCLVLSTTAIRVGTGAATKLYTYESLDDPIADDNFGSFVTVGSEETGVYHQAIKTCSIHNQVGGTRDACASELEWLTYTRSELH